MRKRQTDVPSNPESSPKQSSPRNFTQVECESSAPAVSNIWCMAPHYVYVVLTLDS